MQLGRVVTKRTHLEPSQGTLCGASGFRQWSLAVSFSFVRLHHSLVMVLGDTVSA